MLLVVLLATRKEFKNPLLIMLVSVRLKRVPNLDILSAPTSNRRLSLPTVGIVSATISSKTGFTEWHSSRGG